MKNLIFAVVFLTSFLASEGADKLRFLSTDYDFGTWSEKQGVRTGSVKIVNEGDSPSFIKRVRPSCGCTGADFYKGIIMPGDTAFVSFTYNPAGRPGEFEKTVKVYTGENSDITTITIRGTIIGSAESLEGTYPYSAGPARLSVRKIDFGKVPPSRLRHDFIRAYNQTGDTIFPAAININGPLSITMSSDTVLPGRFFSIAVCLDTSGATVPDEHELSFRVVGDKTRPEEGIDIAVKYFLESLRETLSPEQLAVAPKVYLAANVVDIKLNRDKPTKFRFKVSNTGKSLLRIKRISAPEDSGVKFQRWPVHIEPGKSGWVEGSVTIPEGKQILSTDIHVYTNDPLRPDVKQRIAGNYR